MRTQLLPRSRFSRLFVFDLYARSNEFQICCRCSSGVKVLPSTKAPVIRNSEDALKQEKYQPQHAGHARSNTDSLVFGEWTRGCSYAPRALRRCSRHGGLVVHYFPASSITTEVPHLIPSSLRGCATPPHKHWPFSYYFNFFRPARL